MLSVQAEWKRRADKDRFQELEATHLWSSLNTDYKVSVQESSFRAARLPPRQMPPTGGDDTRDITEPVTGGSWQGWFHIWAGIRFRMRSKSSVPDEKFRELPFVLP